MEYLQNTVVQLRTIFKKYQERMLLLVAFLLFSVAIFYCLRQQTQAFYFQDETDHVAMGWMMENYHKILYTDLSTNHQPIPVLFGLLLVKIIRYATLFQLIEYIRIAVFIYASLWGLALTLRFRWKGLFSYALTYSVGYYFFAWHVLAESIATPLVIFLFLYLSERLFPQKAKTVTQKPHVFDSITLGISLSLLCATLLPAWPFAAVVGICMLYLSSKVERIYTISAAFAAGAWLLLFITPLAWYRESVLNNMLYMIPYESKHSFFESLTIGLYPFLSFLSPSNGLSLKFLPILLLSVVLLAVAFIQKRIIWSKKLLISGALLYVLLISLNLRVTQFPVAFYQGFHLFPFVAGFFTLLTLIVARARSLMGLKQANIVAFLVLTLIVLSNLSWGYHRTDKLNEYYVQYGTQESYAQLMKVVKSTDDTLFSGPNGHGYMNMIAGLPIAGRQLFHLQWAYLSPELRAEFTTLFATNPPSFVYFTEDESGYHRDLQPILAREYTEVLHDHKRTFLFFRNEKVKNISAAQTQYMKEKDFTFAQE